MAYSQESIIAVLEKILDRNYFTGVEVADSFLGDDKMPGYALSFNRITYVANGTLQLDIGSGRDYTAKEFSAGTTLAMKPFVKTNGRWDKPYETIAIVSHSNYLRITHVNHTEVGAPHYIPDSYYHLQDSLRKNTVDAVNLICNLQADEASGLVGAELMHVLFTMLLTDIKNSKYSEYSKANALWHKIIDLLAQLPFEDQNRPAIAAYFKVTESYVSRIFQHFSNMTFTEYVRSERLKKAEQLLNETDLTIDEIAWHCGFQSSSYFIKLFRKTYHTSPGFYRRLKK